MVWWEFKRSGQIEIRKRVRILIWCQLQSALETLGAWILHCKWTFFFSAWIKMLAQQTYFTASGAVLTQELHWDSADCFWQHVSWPCVKTGGYGVSRRLLCSAHLAQCWALPDWQWGWKHRWRRCKTPKTQRPSPMLLSPPVLRRRENMQTPVRAVN